MTLSLTNKYPPHFGTLGPIGIPNAVKKRVDKILNSNFTNNINKITIGKRCHKKNLFTTLVAFLALVVLLITTNLKHKSTYIPKNIEALNEDDAYSACKFFINQNINVQSVLEFKNCSSGTGSFRKNQGIIMRIARMDELYRFFKAKEYEEFICFLELKNGLIYPRLITKNDNLEEIRKTLAEWGDGWPLKPRLGVDLEFATRVCQE